mgnify:CR=1 FL=1
MPKDIFEIKTFTPGTITAASERDVSPSTATRSLNLDPFSIEGRLSGIKDSTYLKATGFLDGSTDALTGIGTPVDMKFIDNKGTKVLAWFNRDDSKIYKIDDISLPSGIAVTSLDTILPAGSDGSMQVNSSELYFGRGELFTKWVGFPQYKQFGNDNTSTLVMEDARLETTSVLDSYYKVVSVIDGGVRYFYATHFRGHYIHKFAQTGDQAYKLIGKSAKYFGSIQGLALRYLGITNTDGNINEPVLWVYDASVGDNGTLYSYDGSSASVGIEAALSNGPTRSGTTIFESGITDIIEQADKIWYGKGYDVIDGKDFGDDLIWSSSIPTTSAATALTNNTPKLLNFYGEGTNTAANLKGWFSLNRKGRFNTIPVDSLDIDESGGATQCFSVALTQPSYQGLHGSLRAKDQAAGRFYFQANDEPATHFDTFQTSGALRTTGRAVFPALHAVAHHDEIGPLFGPESNAYWTNNFSVPRGQSPKYKGAASSSDADTQNVDRSSFQTKLSNGTDYNDWYYNDDSGNISSDRVRWNPGANGYGQLENGGRFGVTTGGTDDEDRSDQIAAEGKGYFALGGHMDPRAVMVTSNNININPIKIDGSVFQHPTSGTLNPNRYTIRSNNTWGMTYMNHTPTDWYDEEWNLLFWGSNDFKGANASNASAGAQAGCGVNSTNQDDSSGATTHFIDYRKNGQTEINHYIYSRKVNRHTGQFNNTADPVTNMSLLEGVVGNTANWTIGSGWTSSDGDTFTHAAGGGINAITAKTSTGESWDHDTVRTGTNYRVVFEVDDHAGGSVRATIGSTNFAVRAADGVYDETLSVSAGTTPTTSYDRHLLSFIPTSDFDGKIKNIKLYIAPTTFKTMLPTSWNHGTTGTLINQPVGVNWTTAGYKHMGSQTTSGFNMSDDHGTGEDIGDWADGLGDPANNGTCPGDGQMKRETCTNGTIHGDYVSTLPAQHWSLNDYCGMMMPFNRHIMHVDSLNKLIFVVNPLYKGYGYPNTDVAEIDTGAVKGHIDRSFTKASCTHTADSNTVTVADTSDLWVGQTVYHATAFPAGTYITSITENTSFTTSKNALEGSPTTSSLTIGRYVSTDQGTGGNRCVIYIYGYDNFGATKYIGFKHVVRDCMYYYRGNATHKPGGTLSDPFVTVSDIYGKPSNNNGGVLLINALHMDQYGNANGNKGNQSNEDIEADGHTRPNTLIRVMYGVSGKGHDATITNWIVPENQGNLYDSEFENEASQNERDDGYYNENAVLKKVAHKIGLKHNKSYGTNLCGSGGSMGSYIGYTNFNSDDGIFYKESFEQEDRTDSRLWIAAGNSAPNNDSFDGRQAKRWNFINEVGTHLWVNNINDSNHLENFNIKTTYARGRLAIAHETLDTDISHLAVPYNEDGVGDTVAEKDHGQVDCMVHDDTAKIFYIVKTIEIGTTNGYTDDNGDPMKETWTSVQSFSTLGKGLGLPYTGDKPGRVWRNLRPFSGNTSSDYNGPKAIDHVVFRRLWKDDADFSTGNSTNQVGGKFGQAFISNDNKFSQTNSTGGLGKFYTDGVPDNDSGTWQVESQLLETPVFTEKDATTGLVKSPGEQTRYLILGGKAFTMYDVEHDLADAFDIDSGGGPPCRCAGTRPKALGFSGVVAIPIDGNGHFRTDPELTDEQNIIKGNTGDWSHMANLPANGNPRDITKQIHSIIDANKLGYSIDSEELGFEEYDKNFEDLWQWYQGRQLDGPIIGYDNRIHTMFSFGGVQGLGRNQDRVGTYFMTTSSVVATEGHRRWRLYANTFNQSPALHSPKVNLFPVGPDGSDNKYVGLLLSSMHPNVRANSYFDGTGTLANASAGTLINEDTRGATYLANSGSAKNSLATIGSPSRNMVALIKAGQASGETKAMGSDSGYILGDADVSKLHAIGRDTSTMYGSNNLQQDVGARNYLRLLSITQVYDNNYPGISGSNTGQSQSARYLMTFKRKENDYKKEGDFIYNQSGLAMFSGDTSDIYTATPLTAALSNNLSLKVAWLPSDNNQNAFQNNIHFPNITAVGIDHGNTGATLTEEDGDIHVNYFVGDDNNIAKDSPTAGWAEGLIDKSYDGTNGNAGIFKNQSGKLSNTINITVNSDSNGTWADASKQYFYKCSFMYDGYQESPLGDDYPAPAGSSGNLKLNIRINSSDLLSKRVSHLNIYRSEAPGGSESPLGFYRLVDSILLDTQWAAGNDPNDSPTFGDFRELTFIDKGYSGSDYESSSGINEVIDDTSLSYYDSCQLNNHLFVSRIGHRMIEGGDSMIAKSLPYNYSMFDITKDILRMPFTPTAIESFSNRIFVFDNSNVHKVEPTNLYIEDSYKGAGCTSSKSIVSCEAGLFWCDSNNIYTTTGAGVTPIGNAIKSGDPSSWENIDISFAPLVGYDSFLKSIIVIHKNTADVYVSGETANIYRAWAYNIPKQRWDLYDLGSNIIKSITNDNDGRLLYVENDNLLKFASSATLHKDWVWVSGNLTMGHDNVYKKVYNVPSVASDGVTVTYGILSAADSNPTTSLLSDNKIANADKKTKQVKLKAKAVSNGSNNKSLDSLGIVFRKLKPTSI